MSDYYFLSPSDVSKSRIRQERDKAQRLRKTHWWTQKIQAGICHYCGAKGLSKELTMDHVVPLARGGKSSKGNLVPSCKKCNSEKGLRTPAEQVLRNS